MTRFLLEEEISQSIFNVKAFQTYKINDRIKVARKSNVIQDGMFFIGDEVACQYQGKYFFPGTIMNLQMEVKFFDGEIQVDNNKDTIKPLAEFFIGKKLLNSFTLSFIFVFHFCVYYF